MNKVIRCAIIGCGDVAGVYDKKMPRGWSLTHAGAYHIHTATRLIAAADISPRALKAFGRKWGVDRLYTDYRRMLEAEDIDILSICLPTERHHEAFRHACEAGIPAIWCEKPLAYDVKEAEDMARLARRRVVAVNYFRRWNATIAKIRDEIRRGDHGRIVSVIARYTKGLHVNGSHLIDLSRWFFGEPRKISVIRSYGSGRDMAIDFAADFAEDIRVYFLHVPDAKHVFIDFDIVTDKARAAIVQRGQGIDLYRPAPEPYYKKFKMLKKTCGVETAWRYCTKRALSEIIGCLRKGGKASCTAEDGLKTAKICDAVIKKMMLKEKV